MKKSLFDCPFLRYYRILSGDKTIEWRSEYHNENIAEDVFSHCDCIVVPSTWDENSPLVIHEAQQVRIPVITAGMTFNIFMNDISTNQVLKNMEECQNS